MQHWEIKALELEVSALKHLDGVLAGHELAISIGLVYLLMVMGVCLLVLMFCGRRKSFHVRPVIFIDLSPPPPPLQETFNPFPPVRECDCDHDHDDWTD